MVPQFGVDVQIGSAVTGSGGYTVLNSSVIGVLVVTACGRGAVRTIDEIDLVDNVETKPRGKSPVYYIIVVEEGQSCAVLGSPSYRLISRSTKTPS